MPVKNTEVQFLQGYDTLLLVRPLSMAHEISAEVIPFQTSLSFDPQRDTDTNQTKSGIVPTTASLETDLEVEFVNNISKAADWLLDSLLNEGEIECWVVYRKRVNGEGKVFAIYMRGKVTEDSNDNDPDDNSTRDVTFTISGKPQLGWTKLPDDIQAELAYVFRGVGVIERDEKNDGTDGQGTPWNKGTDTGAGTDPDELVKQSKRTNPSA